MKKLLFYLNFLIPFPVICQVPNSSFENWINNENVEPLGWKTNNQIHFISVTQTNDSYIGNYALQIINNGGDGYEGPTPGWARTYFSSNHPIAQLSAYIKCDSLTGTGKGIIRLLGFTGSHAQQIGYWETVDIMPQYTLVEILLDPVVIFDSIKIEINAFAEMNEVGWPTGYVRLKVDKLNDGFTSGPINKDCKPAVRLFPNPFNGEFSILDQERTLSRYTLCNLNGDLLISGKIESSQTRVKLEGLPQGTYLFSAWNKAGLVSTCLIVLR